MIEIGINRRYNIERLQKYLNYELSSSFIVVLYFLTDLAMILMAIAALLFTPLLLKTLFEERKFGWITFFLIVVVIPAVLIFTWDINPQYKVILQAIPLALFYFYCFILKMVIGDW
ncbi:MAG: hypothetical protein ACM3S2_19985 [Ignavibacteriales bacterium]